MAFRRSLVHEATGLVGALKLAANQLQGENVPEAVRLRRGRLYAIAATMLDGDVLSSPTSGDYTALLPAVNALPPQHATDADDDPFWQWMTLAALAESDADFPLARVMVNNVMMRISESPTSAVQREQLAVCWARRGRLARQSGDLADAAECYDEAQRLVRGHVSVDAWVQSRLGLSVVSFLKGNLPLAVQQLKRVVAKRPIVAVMYRISAHQALSTLHRRHKQYIDALLHGWQAYDLLIGDGIRRQEVLIPLCEIALEAGELGAAEVGFEQILVHAEHERVIAPVHVGLCHVWRVRALQARDDDERSTAYTGLRNALRRLEDALTRIIQPNEQVNGVIEIAEARLALREYQDAALQAERARKIATEHGYNDQMFRAESLLEKISAESRRTVAASSAVSPNDTQVRMPTSQRAHRVVKRFMTLAST